MASKLAAGAALAAVCLLQDTHAFTLAPTGLSARLARPAVQSLRAVPFSGFKSRPAAVARSPASARRQCVRLPTELAHLSPAGLSAASSDTPLLSPFSLTERGRRRQAAVQMGYGRTATAAAALAGTSQAVSPVALIVVFGCLAAAALKWVLDKPSRAYKEGDGTVGSEYDAWTEEGILEYYWVCDHTRCVPTHHTEFVRDLSSSSLLRSSL